MGFSRLSPELDKQRKITLETSFILEYMPVAPENYTKVYLAGLGFASTPDNDLEGIAIVLNMETSAVLEAFNYWAAQGLVNVSPDPPSVEYLPVVPYSRRIKKYSKEKYKAFNDQLHAMIKDRNILPNEYDEYYNLMESYHIEDKALLTIIGYCIRLKGASITYPYILAVAKNLAHEGYTTYDRVQEKLSELDLYDKDLQAVIKALGLRRGADYNDRSMLLKWKNEYGFALETIIQVAKRVKKGGIQTLDMLLSRYHDNKLFSLREIDAFEENRDKLYDMTRRILKILGLRYESFDYIIESYVLPWTTMGFSAEVLEKIADYCFKHNVRELEGMNSTVYKFYKKGLVSIESISEFLRASLTLDEEIKKLFAEMNLSRPVVSRDRDFYRTWTHSWNISAELLYYAASLAKDKASPMAYLNSVLSSWYGKGIKTVKEAEKTAADKIAPAPQQNFIERNLSAEELNAMFDRLDDDDV